MAIWARVPTGWVKPERKMLKRHQSQSWSRFGRLNLFAKMNEKIWGNIVCKTGTILDVSEQGTFSQSRKDAHQMKRPIWGSWSMWRWLSKEEGHKAMSLLSFCWTVDDSHLAFVGVYDSWCHIISYLLASNGRFAVKLLVVKIYLPQYDFFLSDIIKF